MNRKSIPKLSKQNTNKKKLSNAVNTAHQIKPNNNNNNINNTSSALSITSSSMSRQKHTQNKILSPPNKKTQRSSNNRLKNLQTFSPDKNNPIMHQENKEKMSKESTQKNFRIKNDKNEESDDNNLKEKNDSGLVGKHALNQIIKSKELPGLEELDKDIMKTYGSNQNDLILNTDIKLDIDLPDKSLDFNYFKIDNEEGMTPFQKQEKLIKKLLKTRNYQNFVTKLLNNEPIRINKNGETIEFSLFNKDLYEYEFLDIYYKHNIPYIILRPNLELIRRRRESKLKELQQNQENQENNPFKTANINESQYSSIFEKSISEINNKSNIIKLDRRESLFSSQDSNPPGTFVLTKIPEKTEANTQNRRLNIAFNKAKDAARVVRRLEYSYSMRVKILLSKPIFQKNAKIIQNWWKTMVLNKNYKPQIIKMQSYIRGAMIRKAFKEVKHTYLYKIPFLREIDRIISRRKLKIYFDKMVSKFGILKLINVTKNYSDKIQNSLENFKNKKQFMRENHLLYFPRKNKCCYTKDIFDWETKTKLYKAQAAVKFYLMHHNEKIIKNYTNRINPKLFFMLKYGNDKDKMKQKLKNFRNSFLKMKELKLKATLPGNVDNKFEFLKYILRKKIFKDLLNYYMNSVNNKDPKYQQKMKMKTLLNHLRNKLNKDKLKKAFMKWNIKANYLKEYMKILRLDKLYIIEAIFRYQKKYREKVFMLLLNSETQEKKEKKNEGIKAIYNLYNRRNGSDYKNNLMRRILQKWKKNSILSKMDEAAKKINLKAKSFMNKLHQKKMDALLNCFNIRNKVFKEKLRLWKFNSRKINHHFNFFKNKTLSIVKMRQKLKCLKKNFESLLRRKKEQLSKYFNRFKTNTGVRKLVLIKVQLCFFDENKEIISNDKYSMMKYVRNMNYVDIEKIKKDIILKKNFDFWKIEKKVNGLKRLCGKRISYLCTRAFYLEKLKFLHWHKIVQQQKYERASRLIQKNYLLYKEKKGQKKKNNINNEEKDNDKNKIEENVKDKEVDNIKNNNEENQENKINKINKINKDNIENNIKDNNIINNIDEKNNNNQNDTNNIGETEAGNKEV